MSNPNNFIANTDYATLKNSSSGSGTVVVPGSFVVGGNGYAEWHTDVTMGRAGSISRSRIRSNKVGNRWRVGGSTDDFRQGITAGNPAFYDIYCFCWQPLPGIFRFQALIQNPYSSALTINAGDEIIDFYTNTFLPPFA